MKYGWKLHRFGNRTVEIKIGEDTTPLKTSSEVETPAQTGISSAAAAAADDNDLLTGAQEFGGGAVPGQAPFISMIQAAIAADLGAAAAAADAEFTSALYGAPVGAAADAEFHSPVPTPQPATQDRESQERLFEHISCPVFLFNFYVNEETGKIFSRSSISWRTHTDPKLLESCF